MAGVVYKELSYGVVGAAMEVHRVLGPGFLEKVYQSAPVYELAQRSIPCESHQSLIVRYKEVVVGEYEADFVKICVIRGKGKRNGDAVFWRAH